MIKYKDAQSTLYSSIFYYRIFSGVLVHLFNKHLDPDVDRSGVILFSRVRNGHCPGDILAGAVQEFNVCPAKIIRHLLSAAQRAKHNRHDG